MRRFEQRFFRRAVEHGDLGAFAPQQQRRGCAAQARAEHRNFFALVSHVYLSLRVARPSSAKDGGQNPEPDDDGVFLPPAQLEVMMERRHREDAFAGQLETEHLQDDRDRFDHEDAADHHEQQLLFATNRDDADHAADGQRAGVAHEDFRGMAIEPEKAESRADQRRANDRQLAGEGIKWDLEILRDAKISGGVGEQRVGERDRDRAADGETIEAVGEIDGVGRADDDEGEKDEREQAHVRTTGVLKNGR